MQVIQLLNQLHQKDIKLWLEDDQLRFNAPKGALDDALLNQLRSQKAEIIDFLQQAKNSQSLIDLPHAPADQAHPLSSAQQRIWLIETLAPNNPALALQSFFEMRGAVNVEALNTALNRIIERHAILRTAYPFETNGVVQRIQADKTLTLTPQPSNETTAEALIKQLCDTSSDLHKTQPDFDLQAGDVAWARLFKFNNDHYLLQCCIHHIATDGWSMPVMAQEIAQVYAALLEDSNARLPALENQYADYALWQHNAVVEEDAQLAFWRTQLQDTQNLTLGHQPTGTTQAEQHDGGSIHARIGKEQTAKLQQLASTHQTTLFVVMQAIFSALLYRHSGQTDFCIGTPVAGRSASQLEPLIGCFLNLLPMVAQNSPNQSFEDLLEAAKAHHHDVMANQDIRFETLVQNLPHARESGNTPFFQVLFALQNVPFDQTTELPGISIRAIEAPVQGALYDLSLLANEWQGEIQLSFNYRTAIFSEAMMARMVRHFEFLLEGILANPAASIDQLPLLTDDETRWLTEPGQFNPVPHQNWQGQTLASLFAEQCQSHPDAIALSGDSDWTYQQLDIASNRLANHLLQQITKQGMKQPRVAVCLNRCDWLPITLLACVKAGLPYVPFEPDLPEARMAEMVRIAQTNLLIFAEKQMQQAKPQTFDAFNNAQINLDAFDQEQASEESVRPYSSSEELINLIFTSGSTGEPKAVMVPHAAIANRLLWMREALTIQADDRILFKTPFSFDVSVWEVFLPLISGARCVVAAPQGHQDASYLQRLIDEQAITLCHFVPSMLVPFLASLQQGQCSSLRTLIASGEALEISHQQAFYENLPQATLYNFYGPTEAAIDVLFHRIDPKDNSVSLGRPVDNTQVYLLDKERQPVPKGAIGEIAIGGVQLASGYAQRKDLTQAAFVNNPFATDEKLYLTGDLAAFNDEDALIFHGRVDRQIKLNGLRVELGEIEEVIRRHPEVRQSALVARQLPSGLKQLVAYVEPAEQPQYVTALINTLKDHLTRHLPAAMRPHHWQVLERLPVTSNGKLDYAALPDTLTASSPAPYQAPRTPIEEKLVAIWQEVLDIERVGIYDDFFALGGHSLLAANVWIQLQNEFQISMALIELFQEPTIANIASAIHQAQEDAEIRRRMSITGELSDDDEEITL